MVLIKNPSYQSRVADPGWERADPNQTFEKKDTTKKKLPGIKIAKKKKKYLRYSLVIKDLKVLRSLLWT